MAGDTSEHDDLRRLVREQAAADEEIIRLRAQVAAMKLRALAAHEAIWRVMNGRPSDALKALMDNGEVHEAVHAIIAVDTESVSATDEWRAHVERQDRRIEALEAQGVRDAEEAERWRAVARSLCAERERLRAAIGGLRDVGAGLANVAYNLGQSTRSLSDDERPILADLAKRWDVATLDAKRALDAADPTAPPDPAPIAAFDVDAEAARVADAVVDAFTNGDELSTAPAEALRKARAQGRSEAREALARWAKHHGHLGPGEIRTLPLDEAPHA
jgi:hypothetical protein